MASWSGNANLALDPLEYFLDVVDSAIDARLLTRPIVQSELRLSLVLQLEQILQWIMLLINQVYYAVKL